MGRCPGIGSLFQVWKRFHIPLYLTMVRPSLLLHCNFADLKEFMIFFAQASVAYLKRFHIPMYLTVVRPSL